MQLHALDPEHYDTFMRWIIIGKISFSVHVYPVLLAFTAPTL